MEFLDVVDEDDNVIGRASKDNIYKKTLRHRIVHIIIFDDEGRVLLQKRGENVSFCPGCWSTSVGGHVSAGETYKEAALREFQEELGSNGNLELLGKNFYLANGTPEKFMTIFKTKANGNFTLNKEVVSEIRPFNIVEIKKMIRTGEKIHPELIFIMERYF